ncbi:MAG: EAL domain-containing protein [Geminicoccaceae bacterium]|nr:EAL domain-containing protein [Geminicoccaceae bacterium]
MVPSVLSPFARRSLLERYAADLVRRRDRGLAQLAVERGRALEGLDARLRAIVQQAFDGILICGPDLRVMVANRAAAAMLGRGEPNGLVGTALARLLPDLPFDSLDGLEGHVGRRASSALRADGRLLPVELSLSIVRTETERLLLVTMRDESERREQEARLRHQATHDSLTGLANRLQLQELIEQDLERVAREGGELALLLIDLDRFKEVNDTLGHDIGDHLLCVVAQRLRSCLAASEIGVRLGGDEFAVLLRPPSSGERAVSLARRLVEAIQRPFHLPGGAAVEVDASVGIALGPRHAAEPAELVRCADVAMYAAKRGSGPVQLYDQGTDPHSLRRLVATTAIRRALAGGQFRLAYQPKLELKTGRIVGAEALLRWEHPEHGPIAPSEFVPLAEQTGSVVPLTYWTIETALDDLAAWRALGADDLGVAVNVAARALFDESLPEEVAERLASRGVEASLLTLELTETSLLADSPVVDRVLDALRQQGVRLSIDDFGTGYSSLALLQRLRVHELKIDRSFVAASASPAQRVLVRTAIELAHNLGLVAVAEGVETVEQLRVLQAAGCELGQGYLFGKAMPAARFGRLVAAERLRHAG